MDSARVVGVNGSIHRLNPGKLSRLEVTGIPKRRENSRRLASVRIRQSAANVDDENAYRVGLDLDPGRNGGFTRPVSETYSCQREIHERALAITIRTFMDVEWKSGRQRVRVYCSWHGHLFPQTRRTQEFATANAHAFKDDPPRLSSNVRVHARPSTTTNFEMAF